MSFPPRLASEISERVMRVDPTNLRQVFALDEFRCTGSELETLLGAVYAIAYADGAGETQDANPKVTLEPPSLLLTLEES